MDQLPRTVPVNNLVKLEEIVLRITCPTCKTTIEGTLPTLISVCPDSGCPCCGFRDRSSKVDFSGLMAALEILSRGIGEIKTVLDKKENTNLKVELVLPKDILEAILAAAKTKEKATT